MTSVTTTPALQNGKQVVFEDERLLVINKPAGLVCHPTKGDAWSSLISRVRLYLGESGQPHLINRLDRETSGLVLVAKTQDAALSLRRLWETGQVQKRYVAIVHGAVEKADGSIDAPLGRDTLSRVAIKDCVRPDGAPSVTIYRKLSDFERDGQPYSLLQVVPRTGRKHQIRIHLAHLGHPIVGDKLYGADEQYYLDFVEGRLTEAQRCKLLLPNHALHAGQVSFRSPWEPSRATGPFGELGSIESRPTLLKNRGRPDGGGARLRRAEEPASDEAGRDLVFAASPEEWFTDFLGASASELEGNSV
jgi:23S rRNA pseudouridine1911/1915/1917 synthase